MKLIVFCLAFVLGFCIVSVYERAEKIEIRKKQEQERVYLCDVSIHIEKCHAAKMRQFFLSTQEKPNPPFGAFNAFEFCQELKDLNKTEKHINVSKLCN